MGPFCLLLLLLLQAASHIHIAAPLLLYCCCCSAAAAALLLLLLCCCCSELPGCCSFCCRLLLAASLPGLPLVSPVLQMLLQLLLPAADHGQDNSLYRCSALTGLELTTTPLALANQQLSLLCRACLTRPARTAWQHP